MVCLGVCTAFQVMTSRRRIFTPARTAVPALGTSEYSLNDLNPIDAMSGNNNNTINTEVFCNVELDLSSLEAIGFDMDFTLAQVKNIDNCQYLK